MYIVTDAGAAELANKLTDCAEVTIEAVPEHVPPEECWSDIRDVQMVREEWNKGNDWAWCGVTIRARWKGFEGLDHLGCCSYQSEAEFVATSGYYDDMLATALYELACRIQEARRDIETLMGE